MSLAKKCVGLIAAGVVLSCVPCAMADKLAEALAKTPTAVQETVKKVVGKNTLEGIATELEEGKTIYEAEYVVKGVTYVLSVAEDGKLIEHGVEVGKFFLPEDVVAGVKKAHPTAKIDEAAMVVGNGKAYFTIEVKVGQNLHIVRILANGELISDRGVKELSETDRD
jgi:hypothetical protein